MSGTEVQTPRTTLAQVAEHAGVSLKTASRALIGDRYVSDPVRVRVFEAARALDYQRNSAASLLASGRIADSIGLVTGDFSNPFYATIAVGIEDELRGRSMHLSMANSRESADQERRIVAELADRQVKALVIVSAMTDHTEYAGPATRGVPLVFVDRAPVDLEADSVVFDDRAGGRLAAAHLLASGHSRISFIGDYERLPTHRNRLGGLGDVLDGAVGVGWRDSVRFNVHDADQAAAMTEALLAAPQPPSAIVAGNNRIALGVIAHLSATGNRETAVLGFDDPEWAPVLGLSVVAGDVETMGRTAARLALGRMADRSRGPESVVLPMRLIARGSGERSPAES